MARASLDFRPGTLDLIGLRANDRNVMRLQITEDGLPRDCTGSVVSAQIRLTKQDSVVAATAVFTPVDVTQGLYDVRWPGDEISDTLAGEEAWAGVWDLQILDDSETEPETILEGVATAEADVTRP